MSGTVDQTDLVQWLEREIERYKNGPIMTFLRQGRTMEQAARHFSLPIIAVKRVVRLVEESDTYTRVKPSLLRGRIESTRRALEQEEEQQKMRLDLKRMSGEGATLEMMCQRAGKTEKRTRLLCHQLGITWTKAPTELRPTKPRPPIRVTGRAAKERATKHTPEQIEKFHQRSRISGLVATDRVTRPPSKVTLPHVSILDGVEW